MNCVRCLNRDEGYGGWLKVAALYVGVSKYVDRSKVEEIEQLIF